MRRLLPSFLMGVQRLVALISWTLPLRFSVFLLDKIHRYVAILVLKKISVGSATIASTRSFSSNQRRISDSPEPAPPLNNGEPDKTIAARPPPFLGSSSLLARCMRNSIEPSLIRGNPGPKRPNAPCLCSRSTADLSFSHFLPNGGLDKQ